MYCYYCCENTPAELNEQFPMLKKKRRKINSKLFFYATEHLISFPTQFLSSLKKSNSIKSDATA